MKLQKCANGHFYDAEKFPSCPHCNGGGVGQGFDDTTTESFLSGGQSTFGSPNFSGDDVTQPGNAFPGGMGTPAAFPGGNAYNAVPPTAPLNPGVTDTLTGNPPVEDDDNKTVGYMNWNRLNEMQSEKEALKSQAETLKATVEPVVGWLVCTSGSNYGKSFPLFTGKNFIGRDQSMDICLAGDVTISRQKHAIIIYEPKLRQFYAQPGEAHELFYLNNDVVLTSVKLADRDVITVGRTSLMFVPFCDERFGWDDDQQ